MNWQCFCQLHSHPSGSRVNGKETIPELLGSTTGHTMLGYNIISNQLRSLAIYPPPTWQPREREEALPGLKLGVVALEQVGKQRSKDRVGDLLLSLHDHWANEPEAGEKEEDASSATAAEAAFVPAL